MPMPLRDIGLLPRHHRSALWWLGILYRRPARFHQEVETLPWSKTLISGITLLLHALPYLVLLPGIGRWMLVSLPTVKPIEPLPSELLAAFLFHLRTIASGSP